LSQLFALHCGCHTFAVRHEKSLVLAFIEVSVDRLFDNFEAGKKILFWKKPAKNCEFCIS